MIVQTIAQKLEYYGSTVSEPPKGYKGLLLEALHEINRLMALQAPVRCFHCKLEIQRVDEWYRCTDCSGHYHIGCMQAHAKDWRPSHPPEPFKALIEEFIAFQVSDFDRIGTMAGAYCSLRRKARAFLGSSKTVGTSDAKS